MNIICPICTESVLPNEDLCANSCGHIFHYPCIRQWIERSKTCPQCRKLCSEKHLNRIYFTVSSSECTEQDVVNLERRIELLNQNYQEKSKAFDGLQEEVKTLRSDKKKSAKTIIVLEDKLKSKDFALRTATNELKKAKEDVLEHHIVKSELETLRNQVDKVNSIEVLLESNQADVQDLLAKRPSLDTLAYMVSNLKRDLIKSETSKKELRNTLTKTKNSLKEEKRRSEKLHDQLSIAESEKFELERQMRKRQREDDEVEENPEKRKSSSSISSSESDLLDSDSPYLRIQSSAVGLTPLVKKPFSLASKSDPQNFPPELKKLSIFQKFRPEPQGRNNMPRGTYVADGMGGLQKDENFPGFPSRKPSSSLNSTSIKNRLKSGALKPTKKH
uniref:Putative e3 ubiquitin-protein ligase traip n=1 Tax=Phlebotomus kandelakii TaxID=1109342 RepID=A0A6B2E7M7_9DIPT